MRKVDDGGEKPGGKRIDQANYDDVTTHLYRGSFVVVVIVNIVFVVVVVVVDVVVVAQLVVTDHIIFSCGQ